MSKTYTYFTDPSHGWLRVTRKELVTLGIDKDITPYSYARGAWVYLEEDLDMGTFMRAKGWLTEEGRAIEGFWDSGVIKNKNCLTRQSTIRSYDRYFVE